MKKIFFTLCFLLFIVKVFSQDIIYKKNGDEIKAKVTEVELNVIKYKLFENLEGPTYTISKSDVLMIKYEKGNKDIFSNDIPSETKKNNEVSTIKNDTITNFDINSLSINKKFCKSFYPIITGSGNQNAILLFNAGYSQYRAGRGLRIAGIVLTSLGIVEIISYYTSTRPAEFNRYAGITFTAIGVPLLGVGIPLEIIGKNKIHKAMSLYYKGLNNTQGMNLKLNFKINPYNSLFSTGITMNF